MDKSQGCMDLLIQQKPSGVDPYLFNGIFQKLPELILSHLADKRCLSSQLIQHGKHVAGRSSGAGLKKAVPLLTLPVHGKIDQKLSQRRYIIFLLHTFSSFSFIHPQVLRQ